MFISFVAIAHEWVELSSLASPCRVGAIGSAVAVGPVWLGCGPILFR